MANVLSYELAGIDRLSKILDKIADATERLNGKLDKLDGKVARVAVAAETAKANKDMDAADRKRRDLDGKSATVKVKADVDKSFAETTVIAERFLGAMGTFALPAGIAAATPTLVAVAGAAVQMTGALGVVPAVGFAAVGVMGVLKLGAAGLGDTFKALAEGDLEKFNEGVGKLAPNAAAAAREVQTLWPQLKELQQSVQNELFAGFNDRIGELAGAYLPMLRTQLTGVATELNLSAEQLVYFLSYAPTVASVGTIFDNVRASMWELNLVGTDIASMLIDIGVVGSDFLPGLAAGFAECAANAADFVSAARESGQLHDWISNGLSILGSLAQTLIAVGGILHNVWTAAGVDADDFMGKVRDVTYVIQDWTGSLQGQQAIGQFFENIRGIVSALLPLLGLVGVALFDAFNRLAPVLPGLIGGLTDVLIAAQPLMEAFSGIAVILLTALGPALTFLAPILGPMVAAFVAARVATTAWTIAQGIASAATTAYAVGLKIAEVAQLAHMLATNRGAAALTIWAAKQWLVNAAMSANPIGIVVVVIAALVAALVLAWTHSETFRAVVTAAWDGIKGAVTAAWEYLSGVFAAIPGALAAVGAWFVGLWQTYVVPAWNGISATVTAAWAAVQGAAATAWGYLQTAFAAISTAATAVGAAFMALWTTYVQPAFNAIIDAGKLLFTILATIVLAPIVIAINLAQVAFNAFRDVAVQAFGVISEEATIWWGVISAIWNTVVAFLSDALTAAYNAFRDVAVSAFRVIQEEIAIWNGVVTAIWNGVVAFLQGPFTNAYNTVRDTIVAAFRVVSDFITFWWGVVLAIFQGVIAFLSGQFTSAHNAFRDAVIAVWNALWQRIVTWWNAEIMPIWNFIIGFLQGVFIGAYTTFRNAVTAVWDFLQQRIQFWWGVIQALWNIIVTYLIGPFVGGFNTMLNVVTGVWNALRDRITAVWNGIRTAVFDPVVNFVTVTIPNAFRTGVDFIGQQWARVRDIVREPIRAAVSIIYTNGIQWVFNTVAEKVGISTRLPNAPGFARGGPIEGGVPGRDSVPILTMPGEYVFSKPAVDAAGGIAAVEQLHRTLAGGARRYGGRGNASPFDDAITFGDLPAFQTGGAPGGFSGSGGATAAPGPATGSVQGVSEFEAWWRRITDFAGQVTSRIGNSPMAQMLVGVGKNLADRVVQWGKDQIAKWMAALVPAGGLGGGIVAGQVGAMMNILRGPFPGLPLISGFRPGAITATGNRSYHSMGRAVDIPPRADVFNWIRGNYGANTKELIFSPMGMAQVWNGRPHMYTGITRAMHFDHVHWAMAEGGVVDRPTFGLLGEAGPEAVVPLSRPGRAREVMAEAGLTDGGGGFHVHVTASAYASAEDLIGTAMHQARLNRLAGRAAHRGR